MVKTFGIASTGKVGGVDNSTKWGKQERRYPSAKEQQTLQLRY